MAKLFCPYVGALDQHDNQAPPVDYPSFENHCLVSDNHEALLLTDQATFCLSNGHRYCPRYQAAANLTPDFEATFAPSQPAAWAAATPESDLLTTAPLHATGFDDDTPSDRRLWGWVGAGIIFLSVFLCGGVFAAYTGWQMVSQSLSNQANARINTIASVSTPVPPVYIVLTATSPPTTASVANALAPTATAGFPAAVTPTPIVVLGQQVAVAPDNTQPPVDAPLAQTLDPQLNPLPTLPPADQATPPVDVNVEIPTRRPTPEMDIPTSTPVAAEATATLAPTPTPTPPPGTPVVQFGAVDQQLLVGSCTVVQWHVENVRSVYYENQPVEGNGAQKECIKRSLKTYKLAVVLFDGSTKVYSTTVMPLLPTDTVTPTPSFTPEIIPTPTWTPEPSTPTPTPNVRYATTLAVQGDNPHTCSPDTTCEIGVLITNSGDAMDNIDVAIVQSGPWSPGLCRADNVCSSSILSINTMGLANTAFIKFTLKLPADAAGQRSSYGLRSISNGSNGAVMSEIATVDVEAK